LVAIVLEVSRHVTNSAAQLMNRQLMAPDSKLICEAAQGGGSERAAPPPVELLRG
jgi:hypothetical protein